MTGNPVVFFKFQFYSDVKVALYCSDTISNRWSGAGVQSAIQEKKNGIQRPRSFSRATWQWISLFFLHWNLFTFLIVCTYVSPYSVARQASGLWVGPICGVNRRRVHPDVKGWKYWIYKCVGCLFCLQYELVHGITIKCRHLRQLPTCDHFRHKWRAFGVNKHLILGYPWK